MTSTKHSIGVWHAGLLTKLHAAGVSGNVHARFADYLSNRKQRVVLPGAVYDWASIHAGVSQGSILGPLLFLMYIIDIVHDIGSNTRLFADATSLFIIVDDPVIAAGCINTDLVRISKWASAWRVTFNPSKTETLLISCQQNRPVYPSLFMKNHQISEVDSHKHLGLYFLHDCTWQQHINHITVKAWARINIMRKLKFKLDRKSPETIYTAFIRLLNEYGEMTWDNCS